MILLMISLVSLSCSNSSTLMSTKTIEELKPIDLSLIEGRYNNLSIDSVNSECLWKLIKPFYNSVSWDYCVEGEVDICVEGKDLLELNLFKQDSLIGSKRFRFKIDNNVIVVSGYENSSIQGFPLILYRNISLNLNIGLNQNNNLVLSYKGFASGGLCFLIFGDSKFGENIFKRIKQ